MFKRTKGKENFIWPLNLRWVIFLGGSGLLLGLFFALLAHYLTYNFRQTLLEKQVNLLKVIYRKDFQSLEGIEKIIRQNEGKVVAIDEEGNLFFPNLSQNFPLTKDELKIEIHNQKKKEWFAFRGKGQLFLVLSFLSAKKTQNYLVLSYGHDNSVRLILVYYVLALLMGALFALLAFILSSEITKGLNLVEKNLLGNLEGQIKLPFAELKKFLENIKKKFTFHEETERGSWKNKDLAEKQNIMRSENQEIITYLQKTLFEKPFPRLKNYEVALYPRNPSPHAENTVNVREKENQLEIFIARFDLNDLEANLWKHRLQEKFLSLFEVNIPIEKKMESLWQTLFAHVDLGPGFLYLSVEPEGGKIYRSGSFYVFTYLNNLWENIQAGETFFTSAFSKDDISELPTANGFLIITQDVLELSEMDTEQMVEFLNQNVKPPAKDMILKFLEKIYPKIQAQVNPELAGFILACVKKN